MRFEKILRELYDLNREMKFPFGNDYGWGLRYSHSRSLRLYVFFEEGDLLPEIEAIRINRYAWGVGGCRLNRSVAGDDELPDIAGLVSVKVKPKKAV